MSNRIHQPVVTYFPATSPKPILPSPLLQGLVAILIGLMLFSMGLVVAPLGFELAYRDKIYPGVAVGGIDLSGLSPADAEVRLFQQIDFPLRGRIAFQAGQQVWMATPRDLGLYLNARASAQAAYALGRNGNLFSRFNTTATAWFNGANLPPLLVYDERVAQDFLNRVIASQVDVPVVEASLSINGTEVVAQPGQMGKTLNIPAALQALHAPLQAMSDAIIPLEITESSPIILDASEQAEIARRILSAPLVINNPDPSDGSTNSWTFETQKLAALLQIQRVSLPEGERFAVGLDQGQLRAFLLGVAPAFDRFPENARFIFNDETHQLEVIRPAVIGRALDVETSLQAINERIIAGEHTAELDMEYTNPAVTNDATAEQLGITELVSNQSSYFYGSNAARIQNIITASSRFHGVLVAPGETFSMANVLGDVSLDNGYEEALIILGGRTIKGVGGGVCQVSTTLFRTVFFGGFPIAERHPHAYRVGYYEQISGGAINQDFAGLDATVFVPVVDFKFTNDTSHWLLMETYVNEASRRLTWKFYSTSDGRSVDWETTGVQNVVEPPDPLYEENPDLSEGTIKQVDWAADGADVTVTRTVLRDGGVYFSDQVITHYLPWRAVYQYGPGTELPEDANQEEEEG
jgi:vancomycin resistance protein YoaR